MSLGKTVISAVSWSTGIKICFQLVTWTMTLVVIRILSPKDYGLMAISQVFISFMAGFADLGLADALVQQENASRSDAAAVFGVTLSLSICLTALLAAAAYPIAALYHDPRLVRIIQVSSLGFLINGLATLPRIYLKKTLRVRPMLLMELSSGLIASVVVIVMASNGFGVWSLVAGFLTGGIVCLMAFAILTPEYYVWPSLDLKIIRHLYSYGAYRTLSGLAWMLYMSIDTMILGRMVSPAELGLYTVAINFAGMPLSKIAPVINYVAFPAFAMVQRQPQASAAYVLKATRLMAMVSVPVFFGISAVSPEIVDLVFGPKWEAVKPVLAVLSLAITFRAILLIIPNYLSGIGNARDSFLCNATGVALFPPAFLIGCRWGVQGVCYAWLIAYPVMFCINALIAARSGRLNVKMVLMTPLQPMAAGIVMILAIATLRNYLPTDEPALTRAAVLIPAGAVTYCGLMLLAFRPLTQEIISIFVKRRSPVG